MFLRNIGISIFMHFSPFFLIFNITLPVPILQIWPENTANQCKSALQLRQRSQRRRQNSPGNVALQTSFKVRPSTPQCYFLSKFCLVHSIKISSLNSLMFCHKLNTGSAALFCYFETLYNVYCQNLKFLEDNKEIMHLVL